jgi:hypothetical protein
MTKLLFHTHTKISFYLLGFITLVNIYVQLCVNKLILVTRKLLNWNYVATFDILKRYRHYVSRVTIKICHNLEILKSLSTNLDPNEATGTIGGNFAFRIVFCNVDIMMVCRQQNIKIPQPFTPPFVPSDCTIIPQISITRLFSHIRDFQFQYGLLSGLGSGAIGRKCLVICGKYGKSVMGVMAASYSGSSAYCE